ncbi:hypothetical protein C8R45DRAFT_186680 [Mycena sanguinolenta]|nr:hypothetical protein C8R45DRAFT_186680 [Mycena sanguinolenta]
MDMALVDGACSPCTVAEALLSPSPRSTHSTHSTPPLPYSPPSSASPSLPPHSTSTPTRAHVSAASAVSPPTSVLVSPPTSTRRAAARSSSSSSEFRILNFCARSSSCSRRVPCTHLLVHSFLRRAETASAVTSIQGPSRRGLCHRHRLLIGMSLRPRRRCVSVTSTSAANTDVDASDGAPTGKPDGKRTASEDRVFPIWIRDVGGSGHGRGWG